MTPFLELLHFPSSAWLAQTFRGLQSWRELSKTRLDTHEVSMNDIFRQGLKIVARTERTGHIQNIQS
jgi:hypothetical protein